ncbi:hypothetical protein D3C80_1455500 [compost metagenome]
MDQAGNDPLRRLVTLTFNDFQQRLFAPGHSLEKPHQPFADMLADPFRPPFGIALADLDRRKKEHRLRPFDSRQPWLIGTLRRACETTVEQLSGKVLVDLIT